MLNMLKYNSNKLLYYNQFFKMISMNRSIEETQAPSLSQPLSPPPSDMTVTENDDNTNSTIKCWYGRFGNQLIRNICASILAQKYDLKFQYIFYEQIFNMGIKLFIDGTKTHEKTLEFKDEYFEKFMDNSPSETTGEDVTPETHNINVNTIYLQTPTTAKYIRNFLKENETSIKDHNPFRERYQRNNDTFIHIRLGDLIPLKIDFPPIEYYRNTLIKVLKNPDYYNGNRYISSDSINHPMCQQLIHEFHMVPVILNEIQTIQFASTCSNLILSNGTFSWVIGVLGFNSKVYYPEIINSWHGNIFIFTDWLQESIR